VNEQGFQSFYIEIHFLRLPEVRDAPLCNLKVADIDDRMIYIKLVSITTFHT
jgi:hypothetical protein